VLERGQNIRKLAHVSEAGQIWSRQKAFGELCIVSFKLSGTIADLTFRVPQGAGDLRTNVPTRRTSIAQGKARVMLIVAFIDPEFSCSQHYFGL